MGVHPSVTGLLHFMLTQSRKYLYLGSSSNLVPPCCQPPFFYSVYCPDCGGLCLCLQLHKNQRQMVKDKFKVSHCLCAVYRLVDVGGANTTSVVVFACILTYMYTWLCVVGCECMFHFKLPGIQYGNGWADQNPAELCHTRWCPEDPCEAGKRWLPVTKIQWLLCQVCAVLVVLLVCVL